MNIPNFIEAFDSGGSGIWERCNCGKVYYGSEDSWSWEDDEYESMVENPEFIQSNYDGVTRVLFQGVYFVNECDCWHEDAKRVMNFLDSHSEAIGKYFKLERQRLVALSNTLPLINELEEDNHSHECKNGIHEECLRDTTCECECHKIK